VFVFEAYSAPSPKNNIRVQMVWILKYPYLDTHIHSELGSEIEFAVWNQFDNVSLRYPKQNLTAVHLLFFNSIHLFVTTKQSIH
jgi:hypothetical protein